MHLFRSGLLLVLVVSLTGCSTLKQVGHSIDRLQQLQFKLNGVDPGTLAGVDLSKSTSPDDLNSLDALSLANAFASGVWPLEFDLLVAVRNPNAGGEEGGGVALLNALDWTLFIDGRETIGGGLPEPVEIPGDGQTKIIPLRVALDLAGTFSDQGLDDMLSLAFAVAGKEGTASRLTVTAVPTVSIAGVPVRYPAPLTIVDTEFTN